MAGFFSGLVLNEGLPVFWNRPAKPSSLPVHPAYPALFLPLLFLFLTLPVSPPKKKSEAGALCI